MQKEISINKQTPLSSIKEYPHLNVPRQSFTWAQPFEADETEDCETNDACLPANN